jgi:nucleotide-binding universal stress UspA family protein
MESPPITNAALREQPASHNLAAGAIVCGTDFSAAATAAVDVAAALSGRMHAPLVLVHAFDQSQRNLPPQLRDSLGLFAREQLKDERDRLRVPVLAEFRDGTPLPILQEAGVRHQARLLVMAAKKGRPCSRACRSGVAEQVAEATDVPSLVVREAAPLLRWASGKGRLRVFVGADFSAPSQAALRWVQWLRQLGPCDVIVACLQPALAPFAAGDLAPSLLIDDLVLKSARMQERYFRERVRTLLGGSRVRVRFETDLGCSDAHLIQIAAEERAELMVIGTHSRQGWQRLGHHSVSRGVLRYAPINVACVPAFAADHTSFEQEPALPPSNL